MKIFNKIQNYFKRKKMTALEYKRLKDQEQLEEYNIREEKYNDMIRDETQKQQFLNRMYNIKKNTYTKKMVTAILAISIIDIQLSYILAFFDKGQVVDSLSNQLCITILGVSFAYMIRAYFDSKAEHKNLDDNIKSEIQSNLSNKISNVFESAGINIDVDKFLSNNNEEQEDDKSSDNFNLDINKPEPEEDN